MNYVVCMREGCTSVLTCYIVCLVGMTEIKKPRELNSSDNDNLGIHVEMTYDLQNIRTLFVPPKNNRIVYLR